MGMGDTPGLRGAKMNNRKRFTGDNGEGVTGLKSLGVRDLSYRLAFLACSVQPANTQTNKEIISTITGKPAIFNMNGTAPGAQQFVEEETKEMIREEFSDEDIEELEIMSQEPNLLQ